MSYSHTKRRKLIAKLKRKHPRNWHVKFNELRAEARRKLSGPLLGSVKP